MHFDRGKFREAEREFIKARDSADRSEDRILRTRIELRQFQLVRTADPQELRQGAERLRRSVTSTGDPHLLALMHVRFAQVEGRTGNTDYAFRHLDLASEMLVGEPNEWLAGLIHLDSSALTHIQGDLMASMDHARTALQSSKASGHLRTEASALANLCAFSLEVGDVVAAADYYRQAFVVAQEFAAVFLGLLDNGVRLLVLTGDTAGAIQLLDQVEGWLGNHEESRFPGEQVEVRLTRARLLTALRRHEEALRVLEEASRSAERTGYSRRKCELLAEKALVLCETGSLAVSEQLISEARRESEGQPLSVLISIDAAGALIERQRGRLRRSRELSSRLNRFRQAGLAIPWKHILPSPPTNETLDPYTAEAMASLIRLVERPDILVVELTDILRRIRVPVITCECQVAEEAEKCFNAKPSDEDALMVDLGSSGSYQCKLRLSCSTGDPEAVAFMYSVGSFVRAMVQLREYRARERNERSLWRMEELTAHGLPTVFASPEIQSILDHLRMVAAHNVTVLFTGETGTGKEVMARELHRLSSFAEGPFVPFNCSSVPRDMLDSQLFGHKRGAFTGADADFKGIIRTAEGGTLFLDEIGELSTELQPKLLRFLESAEVLPLGETRPVTVNVRVVSATNANLEQLIASGRFRQDVYYRLNVVPFHLPPLRSRREEIPALVGLYLPRFATEMKKGRLALADEALEALIVYHWPGNIRQLINELRRLVALSPPDSTIPLASLSHTVSDRGSSRHASDPVAPSPEGVPARVAAAVGASDNEITVRLDRRLAEAVDQLERAAIERAIARHDGHVERAARDLGLSRKGLFLKRQRLGIS